MPPKSTRANTSKKIVKETPAATPAASAKATTSKATTSTAKKAAPKTASKTAAKDEKKPAAKATTSKTKAKETEKPAPKKAAATKAKAEKPATKAKAEPKEETVEKKPAASRKRARADDVEVEKPTKKVRVEPAINTAPTEELDIYVFGSGESGELGLGAEIRNNKKPKDVRRPRLNDLLDAKTVGVVQVAVGGMHCVALTKDQKILTWGVNDNGALGRDTTWEAPTRDIDAESDSDSDDDDDIALNPKESTPTAIPAEAFGTESRKFVQVAATDSASFALTEDGHVFGWGTFRGNDGTIGFEAEGAKEAARTKKEELKFKRSPVHIPQLRKIVSLSAGGNHVLALDNKGNVFAWGSGEQNQLGHRVMERTRALTPAPAGTPRGKIVSISAGAYHSFAMDKNGRVYTWGLNNFGQTGISSGAGEGESIIETPTIVDALEGLKIKVIEGGLHHSIACLEDGKLLVWGRCDDSQAGISLDKVPKEDLIFDSREKPRILQKPTAIPDITARYVAAGIDNSFAIDTEGKVFSWGFSASYRTGLGTEESIKEATVIENTALKGKNITFAGCGGQFSVLAGPASA